MSPDLWFAHVHACDTTEVVQFDSYREAVTFCAGHIGDASVTVELFDFLGRCVVGGEIHNFETSTPHASGFYRWDDALEAMVPFP